MRAYSRLAAALVAVGSLAANPIEELQERLDSGALKLESRSPRGYLDSLLEALNISPLTQTLVFSKTSAQFRLISPRSPRALYFNDEVYVGWVRGGPFLEVSTADADRGAVFYTLDQTPRKRPRFTLDNGQCLQCHESSRTGQIPGHLTRSVHPGVDGLPVFRLGTTNVDQATPLAERFGGWFVTGPQFTHLGNRGLPDRDNPDSIQPLGLSDVISLDNYLRPKSDVVAHLLLAHQTQMHNRIARAALEARKALTYRKEMAGRFGEVSDSLKASVKRRIERPAEQLLEYLLFADEAPLPGGLADDSPLKQLFAERGPLYELDLETRLMRTPLSYLIRSAAFDALPPETLAYLVGRLDDVLTGQDTSARFDHLSPNDRAAIRRMLAEWKPSLLR